MTVHHIVQQKGFDVAIVPTDADVAHALATPENADVGAVVVSDDGSRIDGFLSERDIVRGLRQFGAKVLRMGVRELMATEVIT